ncbi:MAG TPA: hypothetical protein VD978_33570 [Azospirillum sp.]|nr:hypothetical protein [Azospirillum sp.]
MGKLISTFLEADTALRAWVHRAGRNEAARKAAKAITDLRRAVAAQALAEAAATPDPKADFAQLVEVAATAGVTWQDMAAIVNRAGERNPRI